MRIYTDLDHTLINPVVDDLGQVVDVVVRPGAHEFIKKLARDGDLWLLSLGSRLHVENALDELGSSALLFKGLITREDMLPVEERVQSILETPGLSDDDRYYLWRDIPARYPPGPMFDNFPVGSDIYLIKAPTIGISKEEWIEVESFESGKPDRNGLGKAYAEFRKRYPNMLSGTRTRNRAISGRIHRSRS